ncbi:MAG: polysaccharide pyruvyl transferase family protein [Gallintestinimicrobium sp.]|uniref:polysaccharide pyruvyl transferase family protein n=1 Tax=Gallintestinimicrobium sp. TaxID=2981655 RepID=UPI003999E69D
MKDDKIVLYMHAGSGNHGCEAIVNSLCRMLPKPAILMTNRPKEDETYSLKELCSSFVQEKSIEKNVFVHTWYYLKRKLLHDPDCFMEYRYQDICGKNLHRLNISIGGDNYCYDNMLDRLISANRMFHKQGAKTVLYGCSIEPELLKRPEIMEDMKRYDAIVARESLTFAALQESGIDKNIHLYPDSAFLLETKLAPLPEGWVPGKMLGLNISPMIVDNEKTPGITMQNYKALISHILETTDLHIALIPHVVWESNDDRKPIRQLYEAFASTGRVIELPDGSAPELKGYISRCEMFIGARTHATIAAYSSCVPTLVVGYSIKARGIAKDLFGTDEGYVLPVQALAQKEDLVNAFDWLYQNAQAQKAHLQQIMPDYCKKAKEAENLLREL